jgi:hypothetical protein
MKVHLPLPLPPMIQAAPAKPMTPGWMTELAAQEELTKATQRRRILQRTRTAFLEDDEEQPPNSKTSQSNAPARGKLDFLA